MTDALVRPSLFQELRHRVGTWIDAFARAIGRPTTHVYPAEYVGTVYLPVRDLEAELRDGGFA